MKKSKYLLILLFFIINGCVKDVNQPIPWNQYIDIPKTEIMYHTIIMTGEDKLLRKDVIGFYSLENNSSIIPNPDLNHAPSSPYFLNENSVMFNNKIGNYGSVDEERTFPFIFTKKNYLSCDQIEGYGYPFYGDILVSGKEGIFLISSLDCSIIQTIISENERVEIAGENIIILGNLSKNKDFLILTLDKNLAKLYLEEKEIFDFQRSGISPTISPDQQKVSYYEPNGIHIMNINGEEDKLVVPIDYGCYYNSVTPTANWSSDSKKIVYHKCISYHCNTCSDIKDYDVFMYDIVSGTETFLFKSGLNPSWQPEE